MFRLAEFKHGGVVAGRGIGLTLLAASPVLAGGSLPSADDSLLAAPIRSADVVSLGASPPESVRPFFDLDWSLGLRGSYTNDSVSGDRYKALAIPTVTFTHTGNQFSYHGGADGQVSKSLDGSVNIDQARLTSGAALEFNRDASLTTDAALSTGKEDPHAPDVASDVIDTPTGVSGSVDATLKQRLGHFNVALTGEAGRDIHGPTTLTGGVLSDNASQNTTHAGVGLRLGFQLTPVLELSTEGKVTRTIYDQPVPTLSTRLDGDLYTLMSGVSATWDDRLTASASAGVGLEKFDDASLGQIEATLYDASLTYKPNRTLTLTGDFATTIGSPGVNGTGTARIGYTATADAAYVVNDWLTWRASAGWHNASYSGTTATDKGYTLGAGADYVLSRHAKLSADYAFAHSEVTPNPVDDTHTVTLGLTLQK